jgi:hypothetical protein
MNHLTLTFPRGLGLAMLLLAQFLAPHAARSATYQTGSIITNDLSFVNRKAFTNEAGQVFAIGAPVRLSDFAGRIVFLEFYAVW